jgi:hypothetical protein
MLRQANHPAAEKMTSTTANPAASFDPIFTFFSNHLTSRKKCGGIVLFPFQGAPGHPESAKTIS